MAVINGTGGHAASLGISRSDSTAMRQEAAACESVQEIINIAATAEAFGVTALGGAVENARAGVLPLEDDALQTLVAARAAGQSHYEFLVESGAEPLTLTFTIPDPAIVSDPAVFYPTLVSLVEAFIAAYIAAAQIFSIRGEAGLAQVALQIGAIKSEQRAGLRFFGINAGVITGVANDVAFEQALFTNVGQAAATLEELGLLGGPGEEITYPGPGEIDFTGVGQLRP